MGDGLRFQATFAFRPAEAGAGVLGRWVATCPEAGGLEVTGTTFEEALRALRAALGCQGGDQGRAEAGTALRVRVPPGLAADPDVCGGRLRLEGTEITLALLLETLASEGSFAGVREHFPILGDEDLAGSLRFAARALGGLSVRP